MSLSFTLPNRSTGNNLTMEQGAKKSLQARHKSLALFLLLFRRRCGLLAVLWRRHVRPLFLKNGRIGLILREKCVGQRRKLQPGHPGGPGLRAETKRSAYDDVILAPPEQAPRPLPVTPSPPSLHP